MQAVIDWVTSHYVVVVVLVYEVLALLPDNLIKSSSVLTFIFNFAKGFKDKQDGK